MSSTDQLVHIEHVNEKGQTPLMLASMQGNATLVKVLIEMGASIDAVDNNGFTALHYACGYNGDPESLKTYE